MEVAGSYKMLAHIYQTAWHHTPEKSNIHNHHSDNLKSHLFFFLLIVHLQKVVESFGAGGMESTHRTLMPVFNYLTDHQWDW
jgi:hypothetical protein